MRIAAAHVPVHTLEQVEKIVQDALGITLAYGGGDVANDVVFAEACRLLGARASAVQGVADGVPDLLALGLNTMPGL